MIVTALAGAWFTYHAYLFNIIYIFNIKQNYVLRNVFSLHGDEVLLTR